MKKIILVTGCSSGLGYQLALSLAGQGHMVFASMRELSKKQPLIAEAKENNHKLTVLGLDVTDSQNVNDCVQEIIQRAGRIDCLINNAGIGFIKSCEQASLDEIKRVMNVNFMGAVRCIKAVLPYMRKEKKGHIVNVSSVGGLVGQPFNEIYCASKFAIEGLTEAMATYIQAEFNIHFTLVEPGGIISEFVNNVLANYTQVDIEKNEEYQTLLDRYIESGQRRLKEGTTSSYQQATEVAKCITDIVECASPPLRVRTSKWAEQLCSLKTSADPSGALLREKVYNYFL